MKNSTLSTHIQTSLLKSTALALALSVSVAGSFANATTVRLSVPEVMERARVEYAAGRFQKAIDYYSQVPLKSDRWTLAKEEKAWAYLRMEQHQNALGEVGGLTQGNFNFELGIEPFLLEGIVHLKLCQYKGVYDVIKRLKEQKGAWISGIEEVKSNPAKQTEIVDRFRVAAAGGTAVNLDKLQLPMRFAKDAQVAQAFKASDWNLLTNRLQKLAHEQDVENRRILSKFQLLEVEAIQRAHLKTKDLGSMKATRTETKDDLVFQGNNEIWRDELDHLQSDVEVCESKTGRTL